jgi:hypothetical protein
MVESVSLRGWRPPMLGTPRGVPAFAAAKKRGDCYVLGDLMKSK